MRLAADLPITIKGMFNLLATELPCPHRVQRYLAVINQRRPH